MKLKNIQKRDGTTQVFSLQKIEDAIYSAMKETRDGKRSDAKKIADQVKKRLDIFYKKKLDTTEPPTVEEIQDLVEEALMSSQFHQVAKAYILYREKRAELRQRNIFKKRTNLKPYEYPELAKYVDAIRFSYWIHTEFNYTSDIQDFKVNVSASERSAIKNAMLAIAQIEVSVKTFWGNLYSRLPKPEIGSVGYTFSESEVRHHDAYAHLLELLGLNSEFENLQNIPAIAQRINNLSQAVSTAKSEEDSEFALSILLFSLFIEHVSLFSQFLIIMSFNKYRNIFKGMSNAIEATSKEEQIHGLFGIDVINIIKKENPQWFDKVMEERIIQSCRDTYESEAKVVDWILEKGELDFLPKKVILEFIKNRLNNSLASIGLARIFKIDQKLVEQTDWFDEEIIATKHADFFVKRSTNYNKRSKSITGEDLF